LAGLFFGIQAPVQPAIIQATEKTKRALRPQRQIKKVKLLSACPPPDGGQVLTITTSVTA
jgi:hypothetical protein